MPSASSRSCLSLPAAATVLLLFAACSGPAQADGGFMPPFGLDIYEPGQTAFIRYDSATATESLSILPRYYGPPTDFAWIVPVPALPEVAEADVNLFRQLTDLTRPVYRSRDSFWDCESRFDYMTGAPGRDGDGVEIIGDELIGIYRTMTLGAGDAGALIDSLTTWGFLHAGNIEAVTPLLQAYVDDGWYFVTMTIDSTAVASAVRTYGKAAAEAGTTPGDKAPDYYYPSLQPVTFTFASSDIIYPLRISRISAYEESTVHLYVAADHRMTFPAGTTSYANRLSDAELGAMGHQYPQAAAALWRGAFLTKLYRSYTPPEMDADIVLERADDDSEYLPIHYSGLPVWTVFFGGSVAWWLGRRRRRPRRGSRPPTRDA